MTSSAPPSAVATASALAWPVVISQTCLAARMVGRVRLTLVGGGLGQSRTATTVRLVSCTAGESGNTDAVCPSSPTPSRHTSNAGTSAPAGARCASSRA